MQGIVISSTAYGSLVSMIFSGYLADRYGPKMLMMFSLCLYTLITLLSPILAEWNYYVFLVARAIMGIADVGREINIMDHLFFKGSMAPSIPALIVKWFPATERSSVAAIYTSGNQIGASLGTFISAKLCLASFLGGWPLIFYIYGKQTCS